MSELDKATAVRGGVDIDGILGIFQGGVDPSSAGFDAPIGSLFLRTNGELYQKFGAGAANWIRPQTGAHKDTHKSGGSDAFTSLDLLEAFVKRLQTTAGPTVLTVGSITDGQFLKRSGTTIVGVNPADTGPDHDLINAGVIQGSTQTSQTYVDLPGATVTTSAGPSRSYLVVFSGSFSLAPANKEIFCQLVIDGVPNVSSVRRLKASSAAAPNTLSTNFAGVIGASKIVKVQWRAEGGGTLTANFGTLSVIGVE